MKKYENLIVIIILGVLLIAMGFSLSICKKYPTLTIIYSLIAAVVAYIVHKRVDIRKRNKNSVAVVCSLVCIVSLLYVLFSNGKYSAHADSLFIKGEISTKEIFKDQDGEDAAHYETYYYFTPQNKSLVDYAELISWLFTSITFICLYISITALKLNPENEPERSKYTY